MGVIAQQSIKGTIVTYIGVAVGFLTTFFVLTRFLTAEEIGLTRVLIDAATLFVSLAQLGTSSSIIRFFSYFRQAPSEEHPRGTDHGFFFWTIVIPLLGFCLFALLYFLCRTPLEQWFGEKSPLFVDYYYMVLPLAFFLLYQTIFETNANVLMHIVVPRAVREVFTRVGLLAVYLLYAFRVLSMDGFIVAICANYGVAALINLGYLLSIRSISFRPDMVFLRENRGLVRSYARYSGFVFVSALASVLGPVLASFFITAKMGLEYTGIFAIATYISVVVSIPYRSLTAIASPQLARATKEQQHDEAQRLIHQVSGNLLLIGGFIFFAIWCNIDLIFHILPNGSTYAVARDVVFWLCLAQWLVATCSIAVTAISYSRYYAFTLLFSVVLTVSSLCLNNYLIPRMGMDGAAVSTLLANILYFAVATLVLRLTCHLRLLNAAAMKSLLLLGVLFASDALCARWLGGQNIRLSSILRTVLLGGSGVGIAYRFGLSPELNRTISTIIHHFRQSS